MIYLTIIIFYFEYNIERQKRKGYSQQMDALLKFEADLLQNPKAPDAFV